jgi:glutamine synthetase
MTDGKTMSPIAKATDIFGSLVFNDKVQQERLPKPAYRALRATITRGEPLDPATAARG